MAGPIKMREREHSMLESVPSLLKGGWRMISSALLNISK
jgi:hypothetical protein